MDLDDIFDNPLFCYHSYFNEFEGISQSLIEKLEKIKENKYFSYSETLYSLIQFGNYYEHFRPHQIKNDAPYWGTVKIMDENYFILLKYLKCDRLFITFSKSPGEEYYIFQECKILGHDEIDWDQIIDEFKDISSKIIKTIGINSIRAYYILGKDFPHEYYRYIKEYIQKYFILADDKINFNENKIIINDIEIIAKNERILIHKLFELKIKTVHGSTD
jgi:hypothetical protein